MSEFTNFVERFEKKVDNMNQKIDNARQAALSLDPRVASVDGVYITSQAVRRQALSFIWAKYNMLPDNLTQSLGRLYDAVEEIYLPDKNEKSLFNYTHDKSSVYSRSIAEKNLTVGSNNTQSSISETPREAYNAWYGTSYQGGNYNNAFENYLAEIGRINEGKNISYFDKDNPDQPVLSAIGKYITISSSTKYDLLTNSLNESKEILKKNKKPKRKDFRGESGFNVDAFADAKGSWSKIEAKDRRKNRKEARKDIKQYENQIAQGEIQNILTKTAKLFENNKIESLIGRFHSKDGNLNYTEYIDTARSEKGNSRGRNLLNKDGSGATNSYSNPYCRVWTYHHQYGSSKDKLIRPFGKDIEQSELIIQYFRSQNGGEYLHDYSVLKNGFVKITPENTTSGYDTKRCMFSIENLAWKDVSLSPNVLSSEQIGPNGGRIMWFPPYDLQFQETSQANWNETNFIGRGEPIYTYTNTKRTGTLSFTLLIDHPSIMNVFDKRKEPKNDYEGDGDLLRFFAGCDIPMKLEDIVVSDENEDNTEPADEYIVVPDECNKLKFSIYFPNNYSGHDTTTGFTDIDWAEYLFMGNGVKTYALPDGTPIGYEINASSGISTYEKEYFRDKCSESITYYYRHDVDLCQNLSENNLKDTTSFKLNNDSRDGNGTISFGELYTKINMHKYTIKQHAKNNGILNDDYTFKNDVVDKLDNLGRYNLKITGVATSQDNDNSKKLAERRAGTVKDFLEKHLSGEVINTITGYTIVPVNNNDINSIESKRGRRVEVEISYNLPEVEGKSLALSQTAEERVKMILTKNTTATTFNEADYFLNLEKLDSYTYKKINEKIKYFDPAYHSISPEGFNSRLTFLQQCTRQGHTLELDDNATENIYRTAGNVAFGRPPFCVLRIGDFINTKILIRSVNIVYQNGNGMQWDMNPEGIGVQPMFAKVTLQIEIIGGQSLDAPVSRLNNAVSFNYYANTGVYDNRADRAIYDGRKIKYSSLYEPQIETNTPSSESTSSET